MTVTVTATATVTVTVTLTVTVTVQDVCALGEIRIVRAEHVSAEVKSRRSKRSGTEESGGLFKHRMVCAYL